MPNSQEDNWDNHWSCYAASASENPAQQMRHRLILRALKSISWPTPHLLDVGSGQGDLLARAVALRAAASYVGFELSATGVAISRTKVPQADFVQVDLLSPSPECAKFLNLFSSAVCSEVIEHVEDPVAFLRAAGTYLMRGGILIVTVPGGPMSAFDRAIGHRRHYSRSLITQTLVQAGYIVESVRLAGFPFFNLYRLLVVARGDRLASDVHETTMQSTQSGALLRLVMKIFRCLFRLNLSDFPLGWQIVAIARKGEA